MANAVESEYNRIKNLKQNKKKSEQVVSRIAQFNIWKKQINIQDSFSKKEDKEKANTLLESYIENYDISTYNDMQNVSDLVFEETLKSQIKNQINKIASDENSNFTPDKLIDSLHKTEERIWTLKEKLGIGLEKDKDELTSLKELEEKMNVYIPFNRNEFTTVCGKCGELNLLRRRCGKEKWENLKHPFFSGRFWFNRRGIELVKSGIWTKEQYAWVFYTSVSYVDWCIEHEHKIVTINNVEQEEIERFILENDYLKPQIIPENIKIEENKNGNLQDNS